MILLNINNKQQGTLAKIFENPVRADIPWDDIESLFRGLGGEISEGNGSRVRVKLNERKAVFHRPHPQNVTDNGTVKSVRRFLEEAGVNN